MLHTRHSLQLLLKAAGYPEHQVMGYQRYPLANHLYWMAKGEAGGHDKWSMLNGYDLDHAYKNTLCKIDRADTLVVITQ